MKTSLPCPNPTCTHLFTPDSVKGASSLVCPRCGHAFAFQAKPASPTPPPVPRPSRPAPPTPPPAAAAPARVPPAPPPPPPVPAPVVPPVAAPIATPVAPRAPAPEPERGARNLQFETDPEVVVHSPIAGSSRKRGKRPRPQRGLLLRIVLFTFLGCFVTGVGYVLVFVLPQFLNNDPDRRRVQLNFSFSSAWAYRDDMKLRRLMDSVIGMSRSDPRGHVVLHAIDYKNREPGADELLDEALKRLKAAFPRLQYQDPLEKGKSGDLDNEPAYQFEFRGSAADEVPMIGECTFLTRRGFGYWLIVWGPASDEDLLAERFQRVREGFHFANEREGWKPSPRPSKEVVLGDQPLRLNYVEDIWRVEENPTDYDPRAVVVLRGFELQGERSRRMPVDTYAGKSATVQVLILDRTEDLAAAIELAKGHMTNQIAKVENAVKLEPYVPEGGKASATPEVGAFKGELRQYVVRVGTENARFALMGVVNRPDNMLVLFAECPMEKRGYWLSEFKELAETLRPVR